MQGIGLGDVMEGEHVFLFERMFELEFFLFVFLLLVGRNDFFHALQKQ